MVRKLAWVTVFAFLSLPMIAYVGRERIQPCVYPKSDAIRGPCDPAFNSPAWLVPVFLTVAAVAVLLLILLFAGLLFRLKDYYQRQQTGTSPNPN